MERSTWMDVEAPVEQVWGVLREVERWPEWAPTASGGGASAYASGSACGTVSWFPGMSTIS